MSPPQCSILVLFWGIWTGYRSVYSTRMAKAKVFYIKTKQWPLGKCDHIGCPPYQWENMTYFLQLDSNLILIIFHYRQSLYILTDLCETVNNSLCGLGFAFDFFLCSTVFLLLCYSRNDVVKWVGQDLGQICKYKLVREGMVIWI